MDPDEDAWTPAQIETLGNIMLSVPENWSEPKPKPEPVSAWMSGFECATCSSVYGDEHLLISIDPCPHCEHMTLERISVRKLSDESFETRPKMPHPAIALGKTIPGIASSLLGDPGRPTKSDAQKKTEAELRKLRDQREILREENRLVQRGLDRDYTRFERQRARMRLAYLSWPAAAAAASASIVILMVLCMSLLGA